MFEPSTSSWIPVNPLNFEPVDVKVNYMGYIFTKEDFNNTLYKRQLYLLEKGKDITVSSDIEGKTNLGGLNIKELNQISNKREIINIKESDVFLDKVEINSLTPKRTWFPYKIKTISFDNNTTTYQILDTNKEVMLESEIRLRGSKVHKINGQNYVISIYGVNHSSEPFWARFSIGKLNSILE